MRAALVLKLQPCVLTAFLLSAFALPWLQKKIYHAPLLSEVESRRECRYSNPSESSHQDQGDAPWKYI